MVGQSYAMSLLNGELDGNPNRSIKVSEKSKFRYETGTKKKTKGSKV